MGIRSGLAGFLLRRTRQGVSVRAPGNVSRSLRRRHDVRQPGSQTLRAPQGRRSFAARTTLLAVLAVVALSVTTMLGGPSTARASQINVTVVGGTNAVSAAVSNAVTSAGGTTARIGGANRFATAAQVATRVHSQGASIVYLATGPVP